MLPTVEIYIVRIILKTRVEKFDFTELSAILMTFNKKEEREQEYGNCLLFFIYQDLDIKYRLLVSHIVVILAVKMI